MLPHWRISNNRAGVDSTLEKSTHETYNKIFFLKLSECVHKRQRAFDLRVQRLRSIRIPLRRVPNGYLRVKRFGNYQLIFKFKESTKSGNYENAYRRKEVVMYKTKFIVTPEMSVLRRFQIWTVKFVNMAVTHLYYVIVMACNEMLVVLV